MAAGSVHHVAMNVSDLERSVDFYAGVLGLRTTLHMELAGKSFERLLHLPAGTTGRVAYVQGDLRIGQIELIEWTLPDGTRAQVERPRHPPDGVGFATGGLRLLSFSVTEALTEWRATFAENGVTCWSEPLRLYLPDYGDIEAMIVEDPDGNLVELVRLPTEAEIRAVRSSSQTAS